MSGMTALSREALPPVPLDEIERSLAQHRAFGDVDYIVDRFRTCLGYRLDRVASQVPAAGRLRDALVDRDTASIQHVIGDTAVRCAVLHAHHQVETGDSYGLPLATCAELFAAAAARLEQGRSDSPLQDGTLPRLGEQPQLGWIWSGERHSDDLFGRSFQFLIREHYGALPSTPGAEQVAMLRRGVDLLYELVPSLTSSALAHAHTIACIPSEGGWEGTASGSQFKLGGTIFLSEGLGNPWWVAEHLLHESMHQKLYDFRQGHSLLELDLTGAPRVWSAWNPRRLHKANYWDIGRVLAAFHVYVHLALLTVVAERRAPELLDSYGPFEGMTDSRKTLSRAQYLGEKLRTDCWAYLGDGGHRLVDWLQFVLDVLDPAPPPPGAFVHHCLDLYQREAVQISRAHGTGSYPQLAVALDRMAVEEVTTTRRVLSARAADRELASFDQLVEGYLPDGRLGTSFTDLRGAIAQALLRVSVNGYRLGRSGAEDEWVRQMVEHGSDQLYAALAGYPAVVADAKRRAAELDFRQSCDDETGRLLATLAAAIRPGGRVLEIGTGPGVGTAWIVDGLGARTDVEVISLEIDEALSRPTRQYPWPRHVQLRTADGAEVVGALGGFDLVFADAAPFKYDHVELAVEAVGAGGFLVLDDLKCTARTTDVQRGRIDTLRDTVIRRPDLRSVELECGHGILLASRLRAGS